MMVIVRQFGFKLRNMKVEGSKIMKDIVNKQFEIAGEKETIDDVGEDGMVRVNGKKVWWHNRFKLTKEEEDEWRMWAEEELKKEKLMDREMKEVMDYIELRYGFPLK